MKLQDKVAVITGASRGIGAATAKLFAKEGARVVLNYFVSDYETDAFENVTKLKNEIEQAGGQALAVEADVSKEAAVKQLIDSTIEVFGKLDILINNAGYVYDRSVSDRTIEDWHRTIDTNLLGTYLCSKHSAEYLVKGEPGRIVNLSSTSGIDAHNPESIDYDASKAGVVTLTRNFAKELAPNVTVNAVAPGWVETEMNIQLPDDFIKQETDKIFLRRFATTDEIANIVLFLASSDGGYINGSVIIADGGRGY